VNKDAASALKGFEFEERLAPVDGNLQIFLRLSLKTPLTLPPLLSTASTVSTALLKNATRMMTMFCIPPPYVR
jgi:hypothetical protein